MEHEDGVWTCRSRFLAEFYSLSLSWSSCHCSGNTTGPGNSTEKETKCFLSPPTNLEGVRVMRQEKWTVWFLQPSTNLGVFWLDNWSTNMKHMLKEIICMRWNTGYNSMKSLKIAKGYQKPLNQRAENTITHKTKDWAKQTPQKKMEECSRRVAIPAPLVAPIVLPLSKIWCNTNVDIKYSICKSWMRKGRDCYRTISLSNFT